MVRLGRRTGFLDGGRGRRPTQLSRTCVRRTARVSEGDADRTELLLALWALVASRHRTRAGTGKAAADASVSVFEDGAPRGRPLMRVCVWW
jgi:hypothetical protein